jgi:Ribbon-helix-helix protein, copG family
MVTSNENGLVRVTVTLDPVDVDLLDRLAEVEGSNRSAELRGLLSQVRPTIRQLLAVFEQAVAQREALDKAMVNATVSELESIRPALEEIDRKMMGALSKLEGAQANAAEDSAPGSNTGATG